MSRWLAVDHGLKRIGVAVGDAGGVVSPLEGLAADDAELASRISALAREYGAAGVVVGWPLNDDGSEGPQAKLARQFAAELAGETHLDVRLWDETLSSFEADEKLKGQFTRKQKKARHDAVAAAAFLTDFLAAGGADVAPRPSEIAD